MGDVRSVGERAALAWEDQVEVDPTFSSCKALKGLAAAVCASGCSVMNWACSGENRFSASGTRDSLSDSLSAGLREICIERQMVDCEIKNLVDPRGFEPLTF